jgi:glycosyltransferase involved in cell wall biosynthesis
MIDPLRPDYTNPPASPGRPAFTYAPADLTAPPVVTIVTAFHNTGPVFHQTARSVLGQSLQQWEWTIVDDGSAVGSELPRGYAEADPRIKVIRHAATRGPSAARNTGARGALGKFLVFLDSDDLLEPTAIEKLVWFLESHPDCHLATGFSVGFGEQEYLWQNGFHSGPAFLECNQVDIVVAIRRTTFDAVGGFDEDLRDGLEDWEFWLRCADRGFWGDTVPEYLDWYRRRADHGDRWKHLGPAAPEEASAALRSRYSGLAQRFPAVARQQRMHPRISLDVPFANRLEKRTRRLLMLVPWMTMGGADKFNLDAMDELRGRGWEVTVAATQPGGNNPWMAEFARRTPDVFVLDHFLQLADWPRFLGYLIESRSIDTVLITNSQFGYLVLPALRRLFPEVTFVDYCHMEEEYWKDGGHPRMAVEYQSLLDMNIVSSEHLAEWMRQRGASGDRIRTCYTNIESSKWAPDAPTRETVRRDLGIDDGTAVILYSGRIHRQKQPAVFAATMLRLHDTRLPFKALVAGDGPDFEWLRTFVEDHHLHSSVLLMGALPNDRVKQLLQASDLFFLPSDMEGISLAIYEAMACGVAVVGAAVGGQRELVTPDCGVLIDRGTEAAEVDRYSTILTELLRDRPTLRAMGEAARQRIVAQFELADMGRVLDAALLEAGGWSRAKPRPAVPEGLASAVLATAVECFRLEQFVNRIWPVYSWAERHRTELEMLLPGDALPAAARANSLQSAPAATVQGATPRSGPMEDAIYRFFAQIPDAVLQVFLGLTGPARGALLADVIAIRRRLLPELDRWRRENRRVYIYGAGTHTKVLLGTLPTLAPIVSGLIDRQARGSFLGLPCLRPASFQPQSGDVVIYSSKPFEGEMYAGLAHHSTVEHVLLYGCVSPSGAAVQ